MFLCIVLKPISIPLPVYEVSAIRINTSKSAYAFTSVTLTLRILETSKIGTLANSEDPDEMQHNAAFHQGLLCLL